MSLRPSPLAVSKSFSVSLRRAFRGWMTGLALLALICLALAPAASAQVSFGGIQSTIPGPQTSSSWGGAVGVASDSSGTLYIGEYSKSDIYKVNGTTHALTSWLSGPISCGGFFTSISSPQLFVMDASNNLYVANEGANNIIEINTTTSTCTKYFPAASVFALALSSSGDLYWGSNVSGLVEKIPSVATAANGAASTAVISSGLSAVTGLAFAPTTVGGFTAGDLIVSDYSQGNVYQYLVNLGFGTRNTVATGFTHPFGVMFDTANNLYLSVTGSNNVRKFLPGSNYSQASSVLAIPYAVGAEGVGQDMYGNLYFTAYANGGTQSTLTELCTNLGSCINPVTNVGSSSPTYSANYQISAGTTVAGFNLVDQGNSSASSEFGFPTSDSNPAQCGVILYTAAAACDVDFVFSPKYPGTRYGAIQVLGTGFTILNSVFVGGTGVGPEVAYLPGAQSTVGTGLTTPNGVGADGYGNVYAFSTTSSGSLIKVTSGGVQSTIACCTGLTPATLSSPTGAAVDGAGNVYVSDYNNNRVLKIPYNSNLGTYGSAVLVMGGLNGPNGVAVDINGNVYIANTQALQVLKVPWNGTSYGSAVTVENTSRVTGVAVDGNLNVYAAYYYAGTVVKIPWTGSAYGTSVSVGTGWSGPNGVAVDGTGNVYVADSVANKVSVVPWNGTSYGTQYVLANAANNGLGNAAGVAMDAAGDVFIADYAKNRIVKLSDGTAPTVTFPTATNVGSTDSTDGPLGFTLLNIGNAALNIAVPSSGTNPNISAAFPYNATSTCPQLSTSSSVTSETQGSSCTYLVNFIPTAGGTNNGTLVLTDNNLNVTATTQSVPLVGTGVSVTQIAWGTLPATPIFVNGNAGSAVTVQEENASNAVVTSATDLITITVTGPNSYSKTYTSTAVAGIATFNLSAVPLPAAGTYTYTASLTGLTSITAPEVVNLITPTLTWTPTAPGGGTVTGTGTNTVATIPYPTPLGTLLNASTNAPDTSTCTYTATPSGGAVTSASVETVGSYTLGVTCTPTGASVGVYAVITSTISLTVTKATPTVTTTASPNPSALNSAISVVGTLSGSGVTPTGTVTFFDGTTQIGTGTLVAGVFTITYTPTTTGSHSLTVQYGGDSNYLTGTSPIYTQIVVDFSIATSTPTATVMPGGTATFNLTETPVGNTTFPNAIVLTAAGAPASALSVTLTPNPIPAASGTTAFTLTVVTANSVANLQPHPASPLRKLVPFSLALLLLPFAGRMRRRLPGMVRAVILFAAVLIAIGGLSGCGNQPSGYFGHGVTNYTIVVTGTSGTLNHSTSVTLTVE